MLPEIRSAHHQTLNTNHNGREQAGASKSQHFTSLNRHDSGYEEVCRPRYETLSRTQSPHMAAASIDPAVSTIRSDTRLAENIPVHEIAQPTTTHKASLQGSGQELGVDVSTSFQRPVSITSSSTRRSTITTNSLPSSNTSSRLSSASSNKKSLGTVAICSTDAEYDGAYNHDALALHPQRGGLFMPFSNPPNPTPDLSSSLASRRHNSTTINPVSFPLRRQWTASLHSVEETGPETLGDGPYQFENFVPASCIDWTQPSTRQREYRKIDQSSRGLRALWRRLTPRWCRGKGGHLKFFCEGDNEDDGSVRRYRINIAGNGDKPKWGIGEEQQEQEPPETTNRESRPSIKHRLRRCLSFSAESRMPVLDPKVPKGKGKAKEKEKEKGKEKEKETRKGKGKEKAKETMQGKAKEKEKAKPKSDRTLQLTLMANAEAAFWATE